MKESIFKFMEETPVSELKFYRARLYKDLGVKDNRLQIRIIPHQVDIPKNEEANLPKFPALLSTKVFKGLTEVEDGIAKADIVGVIATEDFNYGFILGPINFFEGNTTQPMTNTYPFNEVKKYLNQISALPDNFESENIQVEHWHTLIGEDDKEYGLIDLFNKRTGDKITMLTTGVVFVLSKDQIFLRVGAGDSFPMGGKTFSSISMKPGKIKVTTPVFEIDADRVKLGNNNLNVVGTVGTMPVATGGSPFMGIKNVTA